VCVWPIDVKPHKTHTPSCIVATRKIPPTSKRSIFSTTRLKKSTKDLRAFHFQKEKSFLQKENEFECDPLIQIPWDSLTTRIAATRNLTSKSLNRRQRSSSSQLASARACVMFKRPHLANKNNKSTHLSLEGQAFWKFLFRAELRQSRVGGDLGTYFTAYTVCPSAVTRTSGPSDFLRPRFTRIWTNFCGSVQFLFPRERTRFNKKPLK